jgi:hypothetical protein
LGARLPQRLAEHPWVEKAPHSYTRAAAKGLARVTSCYNYTLSPFYTCLILYKNIFSLYNIKIYIVQHNILNTTFSAHFFTICLDAKT